MAVGKKFGGRDFVKGYDPRRKPFRGPTRSAWKARRDIINYYVEHCADALLDVLERRGLIPQLIARYNTRVPQGGRWPWKPRRRSSTDPLPPADRG